MVSRPYFHHNEGDIYDPTSPTLGNTNIRCQGNDLVLIDDMDKNELEDGNEKGNILDWLFV